MKTFDFDVAVIGGGPAGLAAALSANKAGAKTVIIEREARLGGILKQCIHDGFGLVQFKERLTGPEYAARFVQKVADENIEVLLNSFVTKTIKQGDFHRLTVTNTSGISYINAKSIVLATGCRERTARQVSIHGTRPAGIFTAGSAQYLTNICGLMPTKKCVILGSGDIGLIMARRLTLEGAKVLGVYEAKQTPGGLARNLYQCLDDYNIPLYTQHTVTKVFGKHRLEAVETAKVDENLCPISGSEQIVQCDALILSVGLIPENELAQEMGVALNAHTKGPNADQNGMTSEQNIFVCGNALHVNDLVDYVTENAMATGLSAAKATQKGYLPPKYAQIEYSSDFLTVVPQKIDLSNMLPSITFYLRTKQVRGKTRISLSINENVIFTKVFTELKPPEMQRICVDLRDKHLRENDVIKMRMEDC